MQENVKFITIRTENAINSVQDLKNYIKDLQDVLVNTEKDTKEYEETIDKLVVSQAKLNDVMAATKKNADAAEGSYNSLVNKMSALKTAWRSTTSEVQRAQLGEKINEINDQLKAYDATIGNHQRKVGSYEQALEVLTKQFTSQKQELAALKTALDNLEPGTDAYNQAFERAAEITHNLQERQQELRFSANDLGTQLSNIASISAGVVGGFNAVNAIMSLTGKKNEDVQKAMLKVQQSMALVQGLKGLEGMKNALKGYISWASKAYDKVVEWVKGNKDLANQIKETTVATEENTVANETNAVAEKSSATGANLLGAGMKNAAGSTVVATAALKAFKAAIISTGIGILVVALGALVSKMIDAANVAHSLDDIAKQRATNYNELLEKWDNEEATRHERKIAAMKAEGKSESEIFKAEMEYHEKMRDKYDKEREAMVNLQTTLDDYVRKALNIPVYNVEVGITTQKGKPFTKDNVKQALRDVHFKEALQSAGIDGTTISSIMDDPINYLESRLKKFTDDTVSDMRYWSDDMVSDFKRMKEEGIQSFDDLIVAAKIYGQALQQYKDDYEFDPLEGIVEDYGNTARQAVAEANGIMESEIEAENRMYQERLKNVQDYNEKVDEYNRETTSRRLNREKKEKIDTQQIEDAHRKKVWDIITGATQSIIDGAKTANQKELANLRDAQAKELAELRKYGQLKRKIVIADEEGNTKTITAEEAIRTKYAKQMAEVRLKYQTTAADQVIAKIRDGIHEARNLYDQLTTAGVQDGETLKKAHTDAVDEAYKFTHSALTETVNQYQKIYDEISASTEISAEQQLEVWKKLEDAKAELQEAETKHTLDQIKIRKDALIAEINEVTRKVEKQKVENKKTTAESDKSSATGWGGFWNTYAGGVQNPSFAKQQQEVEVKFKLDIDALEEQVKIYQSVIDDMNATDAEHTAAAERQAELREQIAKLEADKAVESANIQIDKQKELINTIVDVGNSIGDILGSVADAWEDNLKTQVRIGEMSQEEADKQMESVRALQIVQATINMLAGSFGAFAQASETIPPPYGQIVGAAAAAAVIAQGIAQIAAIRNAGKGSNSGGSVQMAQVTPVMLDYQPQMVGNATGEQETEQLANAIQGMNLWVSVTDIDSAQERGKVRVSESTY